MRHISLLILLLLIPIPALADVAHDASSESHAGTTGSASEASFTWNHTPTGTPKGVLVFTCGASSATNDVTSVTYGGTSMTAVSGGAAADTAVEPGNVKAWFLGSSVPTGVQAVVVNRNNNANILYAVAETVTAVGDTSTHDAGIVLLQNDQVLAEQSVTDGSPGLNSQRFAFTFSGIDSGPGAGLTAGANSTLSASIDLGSVDCALAREAVVGQGARSIGFSAVSDDVAAVHLAIKDLGTALMQQISSPLSVILQ